jgi:CheY-like chemotaxis protein
MIEQIVMNLASNARDAMPNGGALTIEISETKVAPELAALHPGAAAGHYVKLKVSDTGCGMDEVTQARIFEPFFTTKDIGKGTGLGLATVFNVARQHGGWIEVKSEPGNGSAFTVYLPASDKTAPEVVTAEASSPKKIPGGHETVLIVEDEEMLRQLANDILHDCGYVTLSAASGRQALEIWQKHAGEIDLLLTDMVMPEGVSGVELAERLVMEAPQLKVVYMSGYTADEVNSDLLERTNATFIQKPYGQSELSKIIRDSLDRVLN